MRKKGGPKVIGLAYGQTRNRGKPQFTSLPNGGLRIRWREYVGDVGVPEAGDNGLFDLVKHAINPGLKAMLPFASKIARNYEKYLMHSLAYEIIPSVAATVPGLHQIFGDPDPMDDAPIDKVQASGLPVAKKGAAWQKLVADMRPLTKLYHAGKKFVRSGDVPKGASKNDYDMGNVYVGTDGIVVPPAMSTRKRLLGDAIGTPTGELWVSYDMSLEGPTQSDDLDNEAGYHLSLAFQKDGGLPLTTPLDAANLVVPIVADKPNPGGKLKNAWNNWSNHFQLPPGPGEYLFFMSCSGTGLTDILWGNLFGVGGVFPQWTPDMQFKRVGSDYGVSIGGYGNASAAGTRWTVTVQIQVAPALAPPQDDPPGFFVDFTPVVGTDYDNLQVLCVKLSGDDECYPQPTLNAKMSRGAKPLPEQKEDAGGFVRIPEGGARPPPQPHGGGPQEAQASSLLRQAVNLLGATPAKGGAKVYPTGE